MSSVSMQKFDLEVLHWRSSTDRQSTSLKTFLAFLEIFSHLMLTILHGNYWKWFWRLSTWWSSSIQAYRLQRIVGYGENVLIPQLWTGRRQLFHISLPLLRRSLGTLVRGCRCSMSWCDLDLTFDLAVVTLSMKNLSGLYLGNRKV